MNRKKDTGRYSRSTRTTRALLAAMLLLAAFFMLSDDPGIAEIRGRLLGTADTVTSEGNEGSESQTNAEGRSAEPGIGNNPAGSSGTTDSMEGAGTGRTGIDNIVNIDPDALPEYNGSNYVNVASGAPAFPGDAYARACIKGYEAEKAGNARADIVAATSNEAPGESASIGSEAASVKDGEIANNGYIQADRNLYTEGSKAGKIDSGRLTPYEYYGELDELGRCTVAYGCLGEETMPADGEERGDISRIHPSGWAKAQSWERCHLIAWALSNENANERNLVTGTHYMNHDGMRPLEEEVEHYIWNTGNHVLYMSRPVFKGDELVPRGVQMTAWSCEDHGEGISFNVYCFNVTPDAEINYTNGVVTTAEQAAQEARLYVLNTRSGVFHYPSCEGAKSIYKKNRREVTATRKEMTDQGYIPCGYCEP